MRKSYNSSSSMSSQSSANGAMSNNNGVNGAMPARDSRGRFLNRPVYRPEEAPVEMPAEAPEPAVEIRGSMSFGRPFRIFSSMEMRARDERIAEKRRYQLEAREMRRRVERAANVSLPENLHECGLLGWDRVVVIYLSREHEWNDARKVRDNWPKLKIVSKPRDPGMLEDPTSDDRYATIPVSASSDLFLMASDVTDGKKIVLCSDITGRRLINPGDIYLANTSRYEEIVDPETGEPRPVVTLKPTYARLRKDSRYSPETFKDRIERLVTDFGGEFGEFGER